VCGNYHVVGLVVDNRAFSVGSVLAGAPLPVVRTDAGTCGQVSNQTRIANLGILNTLINSPFVIQNSAGFGSSCDSIVMLSDTDSVHHLVLHIFVSLDLGISRINVKSGKCEQLVRAIKRTTAITNELFGVSFASEVASPIRVILISVWEHVVVSCGPSNILSCDGIDVHGGGGVLELDVSLVHNVFVPVLNQIVR